MRHSIPSRSPERLPSTIALAVLLSLTGSLYASTVKPPPRPPGSSQVRVLAGTSPKERARIEHGSQRRGKFRQDFARDDSLDSPGGPLTPLVEAPSKPGNPTPGVPRRMGQ